MTESDKMVVKECVLSNPHYPYHALLKAKLLPQLVEMTSFLDDCDHYKTVSYSQRIWHVIHDDYTIQTCSACGRPMNYRKERGYTGHKECMSRLVSAAMKKLSKEEIAEANRKREQTNLRKYGVTYASKLTEVQEKAKKTSTERYGGVGNASESLRKKAKATIKEKYGVENYSQTEEFVKKSKVTFREHYGVDNPAKIAETHEKAKKTSVERYGVDHYSKSEEFKERQISHNRTEHGVDHYFQSEEFKQSAKESNESRYGVDHYSKTDEWKQQFKETNMSRYGVSDYSKTEEWKERTIKTNLEKYGYMWEINSEESEERRKQRIITFMKLSIEKYNASNISYVKYLGGNRHVLHCSNCNQDFEMATGGYYYTRLIKNQDACLYCSPLKKLYSFGEKSLLTYIQSIYNGEIIENTRAIIHPYELDIYIPEKNIAIEYNGLYWHSEACVDNNYHKMKSDMCKERGIHLIHVFEDDWMTKKNIVCSVIENFLGCGQQKIYYARKCEVREVEYAEMQNFLVKNHMLGRVAGMSHCIGLYDNDELLSLMAFRCTSKDESICELSRYAIKCGINIKGGAERIFKHFLREYGHLYTRVRTFNENGMFKGTVHYRLGFQYVCDNPPNYMYFDSKLGIRVTKQSLRKVRLSYKKGEKQFEEEGRYFKVYNAGNNVCDYIIEKE